MIFCPECHDGPVIVIGGRGPLRESCYCGRLSTWMGASGERTWLLCSSPGVDMEPHLDLLFLILMRGTLWKGGKTGHVVSVHDEVLMDVLVVPAHQSENEVEEVVRMMSASRVLDS